MEHVNPYIEEATTNLRDIHSITFNMIDEKARSDIETFQYIINSFQRQFNDLPSIIQASSIQPNVNAFKMYLCCLNFYLGEILSKCLKWQMSMNKTDREDLLIYNSKLESISEMFIPAISAPNDDLIFLPIDHPRWHSFSKVYTIQMLGDPVAISRKFNEFFRHVAVGNAFVSDGSKASTDYMKSLRTGYMMMYYGINRNKAVRQAKVFYAKPNIEVATTVWSLLDSNLCSAMMLFVLPPIVTNKMIYIPAVFPELDNPPQDFSPSPDQYNFTEKYETDTRRIPVRVLYNQQVQKFQKNNGAKQPNFLQNLFRLIPKNIDKRYTQANAMVFHIHGGGFIAMSSTSHQNYTRKISITNNVPVLSVDYRLAPECPFPCALDDIWQTYNWILNYSQECLGLSSDRIVIVADSAGGNLALALCYKCMEKSVRLPQGLILAYPAVNLNKSQFTPSLIYTLDDLLIPHTFLKLCLESYIQHPVLDPARNPFLSPLVATEDIVRLLPPLRMLVGSKDPLHDDVLRMAEKAHRVGGDVKLVIYEGLPHGALNLDFKGGIKECAIPVKQISDWIDEFLN